VVALNGHSVHTCEELRRGVARAHRMGDMMEVVFCDDAARLSVASQGETSIEMASLGGSSRTSTTSGPLIQRKAEDVAQ
jgi:hypothetical protein